MRGGGIRPNPGKPAETERDDQMSKPILLECDFEPSWEDAKTRVRVAADYFEFPFYVALDEVAYAFKNRIDYVFNKFNEDAITPDEMKACCEWASVYMHRVNDVDEAFRVLYPWFHGGAKYPE